MAPDCVVPKRISQFIEPYALCMTTCWSLFSATTQPVNSGEVYQQDKTKRFCNTRTGVPTSDAKGFLGNVRAYLLMEYSPFRLEKSTFNSRFRLGFVKSNLFQSS